MAEKGEITRLLDQWRNGEAEAFDRVFPLVYDEMRRIARRQMAREARHHTLEPTALVHEAYLKLVDQRQANFESRAHFLAIASQMIRRILVDHVRARNAEKRDVALTISLQGIGEPTATSTTEPVDLLHLDNALNALDRKHPGKARLVELRYFGGLTIEETAEVLGLSTATVKRDWVTAKAWLLRALNPPAGGHGGQNPQ